MKVVLHSVRGSKPMVSVFINDFINVCIYICWYLAASWSKLLAHCALCVEFVSIE